MRWFFNAFWQIFFKLPSNTFKYSKVIISIYDISRRKNNMLGAYEDGRMLFLHNELLLYIFNCKWNRGKGQFLDKNL